MSEDIMNQEIELTDLSENRIVVEPSSENVIIEIHPTPSCWSEHKCAILFFFSAALGFLWIGLNLSGYV